MRFDLFFYFILISDNFLPNYLQYMNMLLNDFIYLIEKQPLHDCKLVGL